MITAKGVTRLLTFDDDDRYADLGRALVDSELVAAVILLVVLDDGG
jgi:hypothetical protein